jgi:hypothetical protein
VGKVLERAWAVGPSYSEAQQNFCVCGKGEAGFASYSTASILVVRRGNRSGGSYMYSALQTGFPFPAHTKVYYASLDRTPLRVSNHEEVSIGQVKEENSVYSRWL